MKLAAIDIGSNASRLLITNVIETENGKTEFIKMSLVRVPLRLGFDVFGKGEISIAKTEKIIKTMKAYKHLIDVYDIEHYKACATSAMREAVNSEQIIQQVKKETGIEIEIISGQMEASFIYENHVAENLDSKDSYLYIDVGGGSTEITFYSDNKLIFKESFNIGTIRLLKNQVSESLWENLKEIVQIKTKGYHKVKAIGSGGNINKLFSISKSKEGKPLPLSQLRKYYKEFNTLSINQRITLYKLREDRADVIVPALLIYINIMRWCDADEIFIPKIGLADGLIHNLYDELRLKNNV